MLGTGLKLMVMGMLMVVLYLLLMILFIKLIENLLRSHNQSEESKLQQSYASNREPDPSAVPVEVLTAAAVAYEADRRKLYTT